MMSGRNTGRFFKPDILIPRSVTAAAASSSAEVMLAS
jgi:hypothetical protein